MKILKYLLYLLIALVAVGVILGLVGPKSYKVERSAVVAGTPDVVWPYISSIRKTTEWSPFAKMDSTMKIEYTGKDGEVGSGSKWESKKMGKGEQSITSLDPNKSSKVHLKFYMPWGMSESDSYMNLEPDAGGTRVTWGMTGNNNFMGRMMGAVMSMDKNVGPMFESGLKDLQTLVASRPKVVKSNYPIATNQYPGGQYLAVRKMLPMSEISSFFSQNIPAIMTEIKKAKAEMTTPPTGIYYSWDEKKMETALAAGIGVKADVKAPAGMQMIHLPASKALTLEYRGGYGKMGDAHMEMGDYIKNNNLESVAPVLEEYITGPGTEPDSTKWMTRIIYFIK